MISDVVQTWMFPPFEQTWTFQAWEGEECPVCLEWVGWVECLEWVGWAECLEWEEQEVANGRTREARREAREARCAPVLAFHLLLPHPKMLSRI